MLKFLSRKFLLTIGTTAGTFLLGALAVPQVVDKLAPFLWATVALAGLYLLVEGIPDAVERIVRALTMLRGQSEPGKSGMD